MECRNDPTERDECIWYRTSEDAIVYLISERSYFHCQRCRSTRSCGECWLSDGEIAVITYDDDVGFEEIGMVCDVHVEAVAEFFIAFYDDFDSDRMPTLKCLNLCHVRDDACLIIC